MSSGYFSQTISVQIGQAVGKENLSLYKIVRIIVTLHKFDTVPLFFFFRISAIHILRANCILKGFFPLDEDIEMQNQVRLLVALITYTALCRVRNNYELELRDVIFSLLLLLNAINLSVLSPKD